MQVLAAPHLSTLNALLDEAIAARIFPGAVIAWQRGARQLQLARGHFTYQSQTPVTPQTVYDLASLSKLWTLAAWLVIARAHHIAPTRLVGDFLPAFQTSDKCDIQIAHLLDHSSGIACAIQSLVPGELRDEPLKWHAGGTSCQQSAFADNRAIEDVREGGLSMAQPSSGCPLGGCHFNGSSLWIQQLAAAPLKSAPGREVLYSCSNYFLLARLLSKIIDGNLAQFITQRLIQPLYDSNETVRTNFRPCKYLQGQIAPTEIQSDGEILCGRVHDEAARFYSESEHDFCGNAGLFADADGVLRFARLWIDQGVHENQQILHPQDIALCFQNSRLESAETGARRGWCWQIDAPLYMTDCAPHGSVGHLGFTGPSLWLHRDSQRVCVVLNNRVHPTRDGPNRFPFLRRISEEFLTF